MATSTNPRPRRVPTWLLVVSAVLVVVLVALVAVVATIAVRPVPEAGAPVPTASPGAAAGETPAPAATAAPGTASSTMSEEDQKRYRTYVSTFVRRGTAIAIALGALQDCRAGRPDRKSVV